MNIIIKTMGDILDTLEEKDYIRQKRFDDTIFIQAKYESVFNKIIEIAEKNRIVFRNSKKYTEQINPRPFDDIGAYNIALYDINRINNIFNNIHQEKQNRDGWSIYQIAYYWKSGVFRTIRASTLDDLTAHMEKHDFDLLKRFIDLNKISIDKQTFGAAGGFPIVLQISNVEEKERKKEELKRKTKEVDEFINSLNI